jgi:hypothetical protein
MSAFLRLTGLAGAGALLCAAACTNILGKFTVADGTGGATAATSNSSAQSTGSAGAGGGGVVTKFDCSTWKAPAHQQLATTELAQGSSLAHAIVTASDESHPLVFARQTTSAGGPIILAINPNDPNNPGKFPAREIFAAKRLSSKSTGALILVDVPPGKVELRMLEFPDGQPVFMPGTFVVVPATELPLNPNDQKISADFVVRDETPGTWNIDVLVTYHDANGKFLERYGHYSPPQPGMGTFVITDPTVSLTSKDIEIQDVTYLPAIKKTYFHVGSPEGVLREYALDDNSAPGQTKARTVGNAIMLDFAGRPNGLAVALGEIGAPINLRAGLVPATKLDAFKPSDVPIATSFAATTDGPVNDPTFRWVGDVFVMIGGQGVKNIDIGYVFLDSASRKRGAGIAPFTVNLDASKTRSSLGRVSWTAIGAPNFDKIGGELMVGWTEQQVKNNVPYDVLYFDRLKCVTVSGG